MTRQPLMARHECMSGAYLGNDALPRMRRCWRTAGRTTGRPSQTRRPGCRAGPDWWPGSLPAPLLGRASSSASWGIRTRWGLGARAIEVESLPATVSQHLNLRDIDSYCPPACRDPADSGVLHAALLCGSHPVSVPLCGPSSARTTLCIRQADKEAVGACNTEGVPRACRWQAAGGLPGLANMHLAVMDALSPLNSQALFFLQVSPCSLQPVRPICTMRMH